MLRDGKGAYGKNLIGSLRLPKAPKNPKAPGDLIMCDGWRRPGIPHRGWTCVGIEDLEDLTGACEMCATRIRYVHEMEHPEYAGTLGVGCICAGHMEEDYDAPRERERRLKNRARRKAHWLSRKWQESQAGNHRITVDGRTVGVFQDPYHPGVWKGRVGDKFGRLQHPSPEAAKSALFDHMYPVKTILRTVTADACP